MLHEIVTGLHIFNEVNPQNFIEFFKQISFQKFISRNTFTLRNNFRIHALCLMSSVADVLRLLSGRLSK